MNLLDLETEVREQLNELMADEDPNLDLMLADVQLLIVLRQIRESEMHTGSGIQPDPATKGGWPSSTAPRPTAGRLASRSTTASANVPTRSWSK